MATLYDLKATVESVTSYGPGVHLVTLKPAAPAPDFEPGQYFQLSLAPGGPGARNFSIASAPGDSRIQFIYSAKGAFTLLLEQELNPGREVYLKMPAGRFIIDALARPGQPVVILAGGTGISPFLPYLEKFVALGRSDRSLTVYFGFRKEIRFMRDPRIQQCLNEAYLKWVLYIESSDSDDCASSWMENGPLDFAQIHRQTSDLTDPMYFLSGPPAMVSAGAQSLAAAGVKPGNIRLDIDFA